MEDKRMSTENCWAKIDRKEGELDGSFNVYFSENEANVPRSVKVRVSSSESGVKAEYTLVQKKKEEVIYRNAEQSKEFTKQGCDPITQRGEKKTYVVEEGKYTSTISQIDADQKALDDIEENGQAWVNENSSCLTILWYNERKTKNVRKNDCNSDTEEGSIVEVVAEPGSFSSTISQDDANQKALDYLEETGQEYANSHGTCNIIKWYNTEKQKSFQKTDCLSTETGSFVPYTVEAGRFNSSVSQRDADQKALDALEAEGPAYANEHGDCTTSTWYNEQQSKVFTKNDCDEGYLGEEYEYVVPAGRYTSKISQDDANQKAIDDINENGQDQANLNAECVVDPHFYYGSASKDFTKNDCQPGFEGSVVTVTEEDVTGGPFTSDISQDDADNKAMAAVDAQGQAIANAKGSCTEIPVFTGSYSMEFTRDNCDEAATGSKVTVTEANVTGGPFTSTESQAAANALAEAAVKAQGQAIANQTGTCTWIGVASVEFTKNDCEEGQEGSTITIDQDDVIGAPFTSTISQDDANSKALAAVNQQGQAIANNVGNCENITVYTGRASKVFTPACEACHTGVEITVTQNEVGGPFTSTVSQEEADRLAKEAVESKGQDYANKNGTCSPDSTDAVWQDADPAETKCEEGVSKKKQVDTNECSPTYNEERWVDGGGLTCSWTGTYSEVFQRNDCEIEGSGTEVRVTEDDVTGGPFVSFVSQDDANSKAEAAVKAQGQAIANTKGGCRFVGVYSKQFAKDNCGSCKHGVPLTVTANEVGGPFYSSESQEAANALAEAAVEAQGQAYANKNGICEDDNLEAVWVDSDPLETRCVGGKSEKKQVNTNSCYGGEQERWIEGGDRDCSWTGTYSAIFTKVCADNGVGTQVTVTEADVTGGPFTSTVSQEDANNKAKEAVEAQGQAIADSEGTCTWTGAASEAFTRDNCESCTHGTTVTVTEAQVGGPFTSTVSKADADNKALAAVREGGQAVANKNGDCLADDTTANYQATGSTTCSGCTSQREMKDTNPCSSTYNQTKWENGGGRDCSTNGGITQTTFNSCSGCTAYYTRYYGCGGSSSYSESWADRCGSEGAEVWGGGGNTQCSGTYSRYYTQNSCSDSWSYSSQRQVSGQCGYVPSTCELSVLPESLNVNASGTSNILIFTSRYGNDTNGWSYSNVTVTSNQSWCTATAVKTDDGGGRIDFTIAANTSTSSRSATITVKNACGQTITVSVTQGGALNYTFAFADYTTSDKVWSGTNAAQSIKYTILSTLNGSYIGYSTVSKPDWVTISYTDPTSVSMMTNIAMTVNTSTSSRQGTITLIQNDSLRTLNIIVEQAGKAPDAPVPAHITLKNGRWSTPVSKKAVNYSAQIGEVIAGFKMEGDENGTVSFYICDIKIVDASYNEITGQTLQSQDTGSGVANGNSCTFHNNGGYPCLYNYTHSGDETKQSSTSYRNLIFLYDGTGSSGWYRTKIGTIKESSTQMPKKGGSYTVWNESPAAYNFIVSIAECGDENGYLKFKYAQIDLEKGY